MRQHFYHFQLSGGPEVWWQVMETETSFGQYLHALTWSLYVTVGVATIVDPVDHDEILLCACGLIFGLVMQVGQHYLAQHYLAQHYLANTT